MHHLVIGEGQIGRAIIERALADGDEVTVLRRTPVPPSAGIGRVTGDVLDEAALAEAISEADAVHATFHAVYDARVWERDLPPRERAVLDAAAARGIPVIFPESMYGFVGEAGDLVEGAAPTPRDAKGRVRIQLLEQRRQHPARTVSIIASDLIGPTALGTGAAVVTTMLIERIAAGSRPLLFGSASAPHTLTYIPDLAVAMLHAARNAERLAGGASAPDGAGGDAVVHAPSAPARSQSELIAAASELLDQPVRRPVPIPRVALRMLAALNSFARELHGISGLWYAPAVLRPGVLTSQEDLAPTSWTDALRDTAQAARASQLAGSAGTAGATDPRSTVSESTASQGAPDTEHPVGA
ncbi:NAD-dependent epimerase/dehydratase family protein [Brachybacterium sp. GCM10030252]|uniref:NAD-dependent epimerase/dehydratase family protein n=1 Tax=Brachybacterium sp. GCM10030252 TaxID=3273380 RepID=UPI003620DB71